MMLHLPDVLTPDEVSQIRAVLQGRPSGDGLNSVGGQAAAVKKARQWLATDPGIHPVSELVKTALLRHPLFMSAALAKTVLTPRFNAYGPGHAFGNHVDSAIHSDPVQGITARTDLSCTVALSAGFDGGELVVEDTYGVHEVKLSPGDAVLYPSTSLHRVETVTSGERLVSILWIQSLVRDDQRRAMLFDLDMTIMRLRGQYGDMPEVLSLTNHYHNLLRQWAEA